MPTKSILMPMVLALAAAVHADEGFIVSGDVLVGETGTLFVSMVDENQFEGSFAGTAGIVLEIGPADVTRGHVDYAFTGVAPGVYGIRAYIDTNGNGRLDQGVFGPREPWGMSWQGRKPIGPPSFRHIAFQVNRDIEGLQIDCR